MLTMYSSMVSYVMFPGKRSHTVGDRIHHWRTATVAWNVVSVSHIDVRSD